MTKNQKLQMERIIAEVRSRKDLIIEAKDFEAYRGVIRLGILKAKQDKREWKAPKLIVKVPCDEALIRRVADRGASRIICVVPKDKKRELIKALATTPARCWVSVLSLEAK